MALFLNDTFTATNGTSIASHTSNSGQSWTNCVSYVNTNTAVAGTIESNIATGGNTSLTALNGHTAYRSSATPGSADYSVSARVIKTGTIGDYGGVMGRVASGRSDLRDGYGLVINDTRVSLFTLATTPVELGASAVSLSGSYDVTLDMQGTTISARVQRVSDSQWLTSGGTWQAGQVNFASVTNATYTSAGVVGFDVRGSSTSNQLAIDSLSATDSTSSASMSASPTTIPADHAGNITIALTGTGTSWAAETFTVSGVSGTSKVSQTITDTTHASIVVTTGATTGTLTISDGTINTTVTVTTAALAISSPSSLNTSTTTTVNLTGTNTLWSSETASGLFTVSGVSGCSISGTPSVSTDTAASISVVTGATTGTLTITDTSTGKTTTISVASGPVTIAVTDTNLYFSPFTWYSDGAGALGANNINASSTFAWCNVRGGYMRFKATVGASGSIKLNVNTASLNGLTAGACPTIAWSIDGGAEQTSLLAYNASATQITLASSMSAGTYEVFLYHRSVYITQQGDYWTTPSNRVQVTGLELSAGASLETLTPSSKTMIVFGDSITEGDLSVSGTRSASSQNANQVYGWYLAKALGAEVGIRGFYGETWSSWSKLYNYANGKSMLVGGEFPSQPNYVLINMGENGGSDSSTITTDLAALRVMAPNAIIFLNVPFSGTGRAAISAATLPSNAYLIDLALPWTSSGDTWWSYDGQHPNARGHAEIGARLAAAINAAIGSTSVQRASILSGGNL